MAWRYQWFLQNGVWSLSAADGKETIRVGTVRSYRGGYEAATTDNPPRIRRASSAEACRKWLEGVFEREMTETRGRRQYH